VIRIRETSDSLAASLAAIQASGIKPGQRWLHHKDPSVLYRIVAVGMDEGAGHAPRVAYARVDGTGPTWFRPLAEFLDRIPYGRGTVPRFTLVKE
jgi:hypothetical protein